MHAEGQIRRSDVLGTETGYGLKWDVAVFAFGTGGLRVKLRRRDRGDPGEKPP